MKKTAQQLKAQMDSLAIFSNIREDEAISALYDLIDALASKQNENIREFDTSF